MASKPPWEYQVAARIVASINESSYSQNSLALETGISLATLRRRINSTIPSWTLQEVGAVARALRVGPETLLTRAGEDWPEAS